MSRIDTALPTYLALLAHYLLADDEAQRESALADATEVGKSLLGHGLVVDDLFKLHHQAQRQMAALWSVDGASAGQVAAREGLVDGRAIPVLMALMLPLEVEQRAHHERRWRRDNAKLSALFEQTDSLMVIYDHEGQIDDVNPAFVQVTGWSALEAALGQAPAWITPLPKEGSQHCRGEQQRPDGSKYMAEWSVSPIFGADGALINHVCIGRDVTRQQQVDDSLRENDKLRAVATLAAGIAHDFNNLLGSIVGLAELCQLQAPEGSRLARNAGRILEAGHKAAALVRQMLDFSRQTPKSAERLQLSTFIGKTEGLLRAALPPNIELTIRIDEDSPVCIDVVQLEQVLLNMSGNAAHAMRGREGRLDIMVDRTDPSGMDSGGTADQGWRHARIRVADTGDGMSPEVMKKIFEPFFTTKPVGEGTGLGLAAVHGIVSSHDGKIEVASTLGEGTTFSIFLPLMPPSAAEAAQVPEAGAERPNV